MDAQLLVDPAGANAVVIDGDPNAWPVLPLIVRDERFDGLVRRELQVLQVREPAPSTLVVLDEKVPARVLQDADRPPHLLIAGIPGPRGTAGSGGFYLHQQPSASDQWVVNHNLGFMPSIEVRTAGNAVIEADVVHNSLNVSTITLSGPLAGTARCN